MKGQTVTEGKKRQMHEPVENRRNREYLINENKIGNRCSNIDHGDLGKNKLKVLVDKFAKQNKSVKDQMTFLEESMAKIKRYLQ